MSHKKIGPDRVSRFDVYWIHTDRQAKFIYRCSGLQIWGLLLYLLHVYVLPTLHYSVERIHVFDRFADEFYHLKHLPPPHRIRP